MKKKIIVVTIAGVITVNSVICSFGHDSEIKEALHPLQKPYSVQNYMVASTHASSIPGSGELTSVSTPDFT